MAKARINLTVDIDLWKEFTRLKAQYKKVFGAVPEASSIMNDALKVQVKVMKDFLEKHKQGLLTQDYMLRYFHERSTEESMKAVKEAKKKKA